MLAWLLAEISNNRRFYLFWLLGLGTVLCFAPSVFHGFVYDDTWTIVHNSAIRSFARLPDLITGKAVVDEVPDAWRPLMVVSRMIDFALFGVRKPWGYHLHSILWHAACVVMLWELTRRLTANEQLAVIAALLFAVHPIHVEAVSAANFREDPLATFFALSALVVLLKPRSWEDGDWGRVPAEHDPFRVSWPAVGAGALLVFVGLLAKVTTAVVPGLYFALRLAYDRRPIVARVGAAVPAITGLSTAIGALLLWRWATLGQLNPYSFLRVRAFVRDMSWFEALPTYAEAFVRTVFQMIVPIGLSPEYRQPIRAWISWPGGGSMIALVVLGLAPLWLLRKRLWAEAAGWLFFLVAWLPTSGVLPLPNLRADRYAYLPSVGICIVGASLLCRMERGRARWLVVGAVIVAMLSLNIPLQGIWRSEETFWTAMVERTPDVARPWVGYARMLRLKGRLPEAEKAGRRALSLDAGSSEAALILANVLAAQKKYEAALPLYAQADANRPRFPAQVYSNWGWCLHLLGRHAKGLKKLELSVRADPGFAHGYYNLANAHLDHGQLGTAERYARRAVTLSPDAIGYRRLLVRILKRRNATKT